MSIAQRAMSVPEIATKVLAFSPVAIVLISAELRSSELVQAVYQHALISHDLPGLCSSSGTDELIDQVHELLGEF